MDLLLDFQAGVAWLRKEKLITWFADINKPAWPNGYGVGLLNRRLGVRVPPWVKSFYSIELGCESVEFNMEMNFWLFFKLSAAS